MYAAIRACFKTYNQPFTPADFNVQYGQVRQKQSHTQYRTALPKTTWDERRENGLRHIAELKTSCLVDERKQKDKAITTVYGDDYFSTKRGFRRYKPGQEELKSYIRGEES